ncbi:SpoIIE family protein phosphatase [Streptomyces sp. NPDC046759]|uniref:SpoIIE family protein phosphatase n=1 Tax=Streptomyces sp. NPDC046759 TaxID=3155019 RepID=UPI00340527AC
MLHGKVTGAAREGEACPTRPLTPAPRDPARTCWVLPDGHTEVLQPPPGLLLGIDRAADYPATHVPLPPGAMLALYTDGLVEAPGTDIEDAITALAGSRTPRTSPWAPSPTV